jgi:hypothetical protein
MPENTAPRAEPLPLAVIDIGSNSGRVVVYRVEAEGGFRIQATTRAALRLVRGVDERREAWPWPPRRCATRRTRPRS